jgi:glycosyltransferase involved in cell wall biosynthesis
MRVKLYPQVERFESASIIIPVINETTSLRQTVEIILREVRREDLRELVIVVCQKTTAESMAVVGQLQQELGDLLVVLQQRRPFIGGALRDAFEIARGSHVLMMASDLETNPADVVRLIGEERKNPSGIVTASRWLGGGAFRG